MKRCALKRRTPMKLSTKPMRRASTALDKKGRDGSLLLDERYWLAVSRAGHEFIHANPNEARKHGWLA